MLHESFLCLKLFELIFAELLLESVFSGTCSVFAYRDIPKRNMAVSGKTPEKALSAGAFLVEWMKPVRGGTGHVHHEIPDLCEGGGAGEPHPGGGGPGLYPARREPQRQLPGEPLRLPPLLPEPGRLPPDGERGAAAGRLPGNPPGGGGDRGHGPRPQRGADGQHPGGVPAEHADGVRAKGHLPLLPGLSPDRPHPQRADLSGGGRRPRRRDHRRGLHQRPPAGGREAPLHAAL